MSDDESGMTAVLAEHSTTFGRAEQIHPSDGPNCGYAVVRVCECGEWSAPVMHDNSDRAAHRAHVAAALAKAGYGHVGQARAEALREAAEAMEAVIADGDVAEVAAFVPGEVGRSAAVNRRDALCEEPYAWLRDRAGREAGGQHG